MNLTKLAIKRSTAILMLIFALVVLGLRGYSTMPAELNPKVDFPNVSVATTYPGAGPAEVETLISKPIEDAVSSVSGVKNVTSSSQQGVSVVNVEFYLGTNLDVAASDVREKVDGARRSLPDEADAPTISKANTSSDPIMYMTMRSTGGRSSRDLRDLANNQVKDLLGQVPGVASVIVTGGDIREIIIALDKSRLDANGLTISDVSTAIRNQNLNTPSGRVTEGNRDYSVRVIGEFESAQQIQNLRLQFPGKNNQPDKVLTLSDIGTATDTVQERTSSAGLSERQGKTGPLPLAADTVSLIVQKTSEGNTVQAAQGVRKQMEQVKRIVPSDVQFTITSDQSERVEENLKDVEVTLMIGALLAVLIVYLFLHNLRGTFIVALAIPTSIISSFLVMSALGFTLNTMTLLGLSLAVGILVDDSIVVLENIYRHLAMGETPQEAALNGRGEIGLAAITITMVDVVVFVPVAFMGGVVGQFFRSFGITVAVATLFSLLMSFTLAPMLASKWYRKGEAVEATSGFFGAINHGLERVGHGYRRALAWSLQHRGTVLVMGNLALVLVILWLASAGQGAGAIKTGMIVAVPLILGGAAIMGINIAWNRLQNRHGGQRSQRNSVTEPLIVGVIGAVLAIATVTLSGAVGKPLGFRFAPGQDQNQVALSVELPAGASLAATQRVIGQIQERVRDLPEVKYIETSAGASRAGGYQGGGASGTQYGQVRLTLKDKIGNLDKIAFWEDKSDMRAKTDVEIAGEVRKRVEGIVGATIRTSEVSGFNGSAAPVQIEITGPDLNELLAKSKKVADKLATINGVLSPDISFKATKPEVQVTLDRQRAADYGVSVAQASQALSDAVQGNIESKFRDNGEQYDIRVQYSQADRASVQDVGDVAVATRSGSIVRLSDIANVIEGRGPSNIDRKNRQRLVTVSAYLRPGFVIGNMQQLIDPQIKPLLAGGKSQYKWGGEANTMAEEGVYMFQALGLAVLLVYMLMAALFNNALYPLIIMLAIPQALVGGLLGLIISGTSLSIIAMIGVIMLMGLVTKNAILLVDFTNTLRARGYRREDALTEAGPTRLRPIIMTTLAQILGALPIAMALGKGSEFRQPLGIVIIGGLMLSSLLTLLVIPASYTVFDDISNLITRVTHRRRPDMNEVLTDNTGSLTRVEASSDNIRS